MDQISVAAKTRLNGWPYVGSKTEYDKSSASRSKIACVIDLDESGNIEYCSGVTSSIAVHNINDAEHGCSTSF